MTTTLTVADSIADTLTSLGFDVRNPARYNAATLKVTNARSAFSDLTISSDGHVTWDYSTFDGRHTSAAHILSVVLDLLSPAWQDTTALRLPVVPDLTLQGLVGRALIEGGMHVTMDQPATDQQFFETYSEITITNPAEPGRGTVRLADHGAICWQCQAREPAVGLGGLSIRDIAITLAQALSRSRQPCCIA